MDAASSTRSRIQELMDAPEEESNALAKLEFSVGKMLECFRRIAKSPSGESKIRRAETFIRWWTMELENGE